MSKNRYVYRLLLQDQFGSWFTLAILRTVLSCVAFAKTLCEVPYQPFRFVKHKFNDADFASVVEFTDITSDILGLVDKFFPIKSSENGQGKD